MVDPKEVNEDEKKKNGDDNEMHSPVISIDSEKHTMRKHKKKDKNILSAEEMNPRIHDEDKNKMDEIEKYKKKIMEEIERHAKKDDVLDKWKRFANEDKKVIKNEKDNDIMSQKTDTIDREKTATSPKHDNKDDARKRKEFEDNLHSIEKMINKPRPVFHKIDEQQSKKEWRRKGSSNIDRNDVDIYSPSLSFKRADKGLKARKQFPSVDTEGQQNQPVVMKTKMDKSMMVILALSIGLVISIMTIFALTLFLFVKCPKDEK